MASLVRYNENPHLRIISKRLKLLRKAARLPQRVVMDCSGVNTIDHIERIRAPKTHDLEKLARFFGVPIAFFSDSVNEVEARNMAFSAAKEVNIRLIEQQEQEVKS